MRHLKRVALEKVNERRWINLIISIGIGRPSCTASSPVWLSVEYSYDSCTRTCLFYYTVRVEIHSVLCGLYWYYNDRFGFELEVATRRSALS